MYRSTSTSTPSRPKPSTGTPSTITQSTSLPTIPPVSSPPPVTPSTSKIRPSTSTDHLRSPQTPASSSKNKNFHPYLIQTTASSLLSRTNSSPVQPVYEGGPRHRVSRSMSSLYKPEGVIYEQESSSAVESGSDAGSEQGIPGRSPVSRRKDVNVRLGMKRSGTLPSFPAMEDLESVAKGKQVELSVDPKAWTASDLAQYLSHTLRKGSMGDTDQSLPGPLINDITSWILRHQVTGRAFLTGPETWTTSKHPPPFLPLLTSLSRRLRRSSLQSRISNSNTASIAKDDFGPSSILIEGNEDTQDQDEYQDSELAPRPRQKGVRGMAQAYDAIHSSASDASASGDESGPPRGQSTGDHRREVWKRWEAEMRPRALQRQDTGSSIGSFCSVDEVALAAARGSDIQPAPAASEEEITTDEEDQGGTIKPNSWSAVAASALAKDKSRVSVIPLGASTSSASSSGTSPPPPYASGLDTSPEKGSNNLSTPLRPSRSASHSVTPTPDPQRYATSTSVSKTPDSQSPVPASARLSARQSLGRSTSRRIPKAVQVEAEADKGAETDDELDTGGHYSAARRVTIRPTPRISSKSIFASSATATTPAKSSRELELEKELADVKDRLKELEVRLNSVIPEPAAAEVVKGLDATIPAQGSRVGYLMDKLGLGRKQGDDGLPTTVRELPVYLFLVGFGVGAVVVRVLFTRR